MMTVYEVFDNDFHGDNGRYYRTLKEAKADWGSVTNGHLMKIVIPTPINKDMVIALLNHEGFALEQEELEAK